MSRIIGTTFLVFALLWGEAHSSDQGDAAARSQAALDAAYDQAKAAQAARRMQNSSAIPLPAHTEMRDPMRADPLRIAREFESKRNGRNANSEELLIFVSTSMPKRALQLLGQQAEKAGAVIILRGMLGALGTPGAINETIKAIEPAASTGASVQIDPEQFARFEVSAVPSFVLARKQEGCGTEQCASQSFKLVGDVSLEYALETWVRRGGAAGKLAESYLSKLQ